MIHASLVDKKSVCHSARHAFHHQSFWLARPHHSRDALRPHGFGSRHSFPDAQIQAICDTVTQENVGDSVELLRRLHASQETSLVLAAPPSPVQSVASFRSKPQARSFPNASSEAGAMLCAETFYKLCKDDRLKLKRLSGFCPFTLAFQRCPHTDRCQLVHICWVCSPFPWRKHPLILF